MRKRAFFSTFPEKNILRDWRTKEYKLQSVEQSTDAIISSFGIVYIFFFFGLNTRVLLQKPTYWNKKVNHSEFCAIIFSVSTETPSSIASCQTFYPLLFPSEINAEFDTTCLLFPLNISHLVNDII